MLRCKAGFTSSLFLLAFGVVRPQETPEQADALVLLAKIDGKATFDTANPKRIIAIDI